jgi:cytochrome c556
MTRLTRAGCVALAVVGAGVVLRAEEPAKAVRAARKELLGLVNGLGAGVDIAKKAADAAKKHELADVMHGFKPRRKGGIGYGPGGDAIEQKLLALARRKLPAQALKKERDELIELARVVEAVAEVTAHYGAGHAKRAPWAEKTWAMFTRDTIRAARLLKGAASRGDAGRLRVAALRVNSTCADCHHDFRDGKTPRRPGDRELAARDVADLAADLAARKGIREKAAAAAARHHLRYTMGTFKAEEDGGLGTGQDGGSTEVRIAGLAALELKERELKKQKAELVRIARVASAVGEVAISQGPDRPLSKWKAREWRRYAQDLKQAAVRLESAVDGGAPAAVKAAARRLNNACLNCHTDFRDE